MRILVVGGGSWGSTFAALLSEGDHEVALACRDPDQVRAIRQTGRNPRYMPEVDLGRVTPCLLSEADHAAELVCLAVPSHAFRHVLEELPGRGPILSLTKGLDPESGERLSSLVRDRSVAVLTGPNHAEEIARGMPAAAVIGSADESLAFRLQHTFISPRFRVYVNTDLIGVELCAASKNVIALAAGSVDGLEAGDNAKAGLVTRGLAEMTRLGLACGARPETFAGLAGMGDLIVTCWSRHSRNRLAGELIARGLSTREAVARVGTVVEGVYTAPSLRDFGRSLGLELPITEAVCEALSGAPVQELISDLMGRRPTEE